MEREKMEAWADALLDQHRTAPAKTGGRHAASRRPTEHDRMAALLAEAGAAPAVPDLMTYQRSQTAIDPDAWIGKAQAMGIVLGFVLLLGFVLALAVA